MLEVLKYYVTIVSTGSVFFCFDLPFVDLNESHVQLYFLCYQRYKWLSCPYCTASWVLWKHPDPASGGRPMFSKAKLPKESKNGFKTISCRPYLVMIFSKNYFWCKKIIKKIGRFDAFWTFMAMYMIKLHQF